MDLTKYRVPSNVDEVFYIPEFLSEEEERYLQRKVYETSIVKWKTLQNRRLQIWGGTLSQSNVLIPQELPNFVTEYPDIIRRLRKLGIFASSKHGEPNHIIVNEYRPSQGIMPHEDGPTYHPVVATISLGSHTVFNYHRYLNNTEHAPEADAPPGSSGAGDAGSASQAPRGRAIDPEPILSLLLEPRSVVITAKELYTRHLHGIAPVEHDTLAAAAGSGTDGRAPRNDDATRHGPCPAPPVRVANWNILGGTEERRAAREGGVLVRATRVSLTCRDVERVWPGGKGRGGVFSGR